MSQATDGREVAIEAARAAAAVLRRIVDQGGASRIRNKGAVDLVTEADLAAEEAVLAVLSRHTPDLPVLAEEGGGASLAADRWIVDPLDGTTNFVHGIPHFAVSVALERDGRIVAGCVHDVMRDECWAAARGHGATCNDQPVHVSSRDTLGEALVGTGFPYDRQQRAATYLRIVQAFLVQVQGLRRAGAAALDLAWVAGGRLDAFWEPGLAPWDVAAGALLVQEAGGRVSDGEGAALRLNSPWIVASNTHLHPAMVQTLASLLRSPPAESEESTP